MRKSKIVLCAIIASMVLSACGTPNAAQTSSVASKVVSSSVSSESSVDKDNETSEPKKPDESDVSSSANTSSTVTADSSSTTSTAESDSSVTEESGDNHTQELDENGLRPEFKAAMDSYEAFYDEYIEFMKSYSSNPTDLQLIKEYGSMLIELNNMDKALDEWDEDEMNDQELAYYIEVTSRVTQKLLELQ